MEGLGLAAEHPAAAEFWVCFSTAPSNCHRERQRERQAERLGRWVLETAGGLSKRWELRGNSKQYGLSRGED